MQKLEVTQVATERISSLSAELRDLRSDPTAANNIIARLMVVNIAMALPMASIGKCSRDGTDLHFQGREDGLHVCCSGSPQHCWTI